MERVVGGFDGVEIVVDCDDPWCEQCALARLTKRDAVNSAFTSVQPLSTQHLSLFGGANRSTPKALAAMDDGLYGEPTRDADGQPIKKRPAPYGMRDGRITYAVDDAAGIRASMRKLGLVGDAASSESAPVRNLHEDWPTAKEFWDSFDIDAARKILSTNSRNQFPRHLMAEWLRVAFCWTFSKEGSQIYQAGYNSMSEHNNSKAWISEGWQGRVAIEQYVKWWEERNGERP